MAVANAGDKNANANKVLNTVFMSFRFIAQAVLPKRYKANRQRIPFIAFRDV